jgi:putative FmdB family regulatory protein
MPFYTYRCEKCKKETEVLQGTSDPDPECKKCKEKMKRKLSKGSSFALKGGGWFKDGYHKN